MTLFLKKAGLLFSLMIFAFQAVLFNVFLSCLVVFAKIEAEEDFADTKQVVLSQAQCEKLQWLSETEFVFKNYLLDVKEIKNIGNKILLSYKIDLKEKSFLEKLTEQFKQGKNKKTPQSSFLYKISEPYALKFIAQITNADRKTLNVSTCGVPQEKCSPPPKI